MNTNDKNIIPFPSTPGEPKRPKNILQNIKDHILFVVLTTILIPISLTVLGPYLSKHIGSVNISNSYVMHFTDLLSPTLSTYKNDKLSSNQLQSFFQSGLCRKNRFHL